MQSSQYDDEGNVIPGSTGFYGTSAAAPHVAGAAALIAAAKPAMDASDLEAFLQRRAGPLGNPPTNNLGHGLLALGATERHPGGTRVAVLPAGHAEKDRRHP